jgi:hypothetical protein
MQCAGIMLQSLSVPLRLQQRIINILVAVACRCATNGMNLRCVQTGRRARMVAARVGANAFIGKRNDYDAVNQLF